jgi:hypothetical protein
MMMMMMVALVRAGMPLAVPCFALTFDEALTTRLSFRWVLLYNVRMDVVWVLSGRRQEDGETSEASDV